MLLKIFDKKQAAENSFSLILEKPANFSFYPGQYLDVELPVKDKNGNTRAFTISSSPTENFLMVTTKIGITPFKKFMENLKVGDTIKSSHPVGTFTLDESSPAVFIAGGIGITPFRSMIKFAADNKLKTSITLIYSNSDENFLFKEELYAWEKTLPSLNIIYHNSTQNGRLSTLYPTPQTSSSLSLRAEGLYPIYYLAGSHGFVNGMEKMLKDLGVDEVNIRYDRFDGY